MFNRPCRACQAKDSAIVGLKEEIVRLWSHVHELQQVNLGLTDSVLQQRLAAKKLEHKPLNEQKIVVIEPKPNPPRWAMADSQRRE